MKISIILTLLSSVSVVFSDETVGERGPSIEGPDSVKSDEETIFICSFETNNNETNLEWKIDGESVEGDQEIAEIEGDVFSITNAISLSFDKNKNEIVLICLEEGNALENHVQKILKISGGKNENINLSVVLN